MAILVITIGSTSCMLLSKQSNEVMTDENIKSYFFSIGSIFIYVFVSLFLVAALIFYKKVMSDVDRQWRLIVDNSQKDVAVSNERVSSVLDCDKIAIRKENESEGEIKLKNQMAILSSLTME